MRIIPQEMDQEAITRIVSNMIKTLPTDKRGDYNERRYVL